MRFFILALFVMGCHSLDVRSNYSDKCDYNDHYRCGDLCIDTMDPCICGDDFIGNGFFSFCCTPPEVKCAETEDGVVCPEGEVKNILPFDDEPFSMCHGRCYNDYSTSQYISDISYYTCPDHCIPVNGFDEAVCQGVSFCEGDEEICSEDLRCGPFDERHIIPTVPARSYCKVANVINNNNDNVYDYIDRIDEDISQIQDTDRPSINYTALTSCILGNIPGLICDGSCMLNYWWCDLDSYSITTYCDDQGVHNNDPFLCSNHTFWNNMSCYLDTHEGKRCTGKNQNCV